MKAGDDKLFEVRHKINRSKTHIASLKRAIDSYSKRRPYTLSLKNTADDALFTYYTFEVTDVRVPPPRISLILGDAIQNMRIALDYLACLISGNNSGNFPISNPSRPFAKTLDDAKMNMLGSDVVDAIRNVQYDKQGYHNLADISALSNIDKHRFLLVTAAGISFVRNNVTFPWELPSGEIIPIDLDSPVSAGGYSAHPSYAAPIPLEIGTVLPPLKVAKPLQRKGDAYLNMSITFGNPEQVKGKLVHLELVYMLFTVQNIVDKLEKFVL